MITAEDLVFELNKVDDDKYFKLGTVTSLFPNNTAKIQFDGETIPSEKEYAYLASYAPTTLDRVFLASVSGTYIILGKINYNIGPEETIELDRYLFDQKVVTMTKGLSVTGNTTLPITTLFSATITNSLTVGGISTFSNGVAITGNATMDTAQLTGKLSCFNIETTQGVVINGSLIHKGSSVGFYNVTQVNRQSVGRYTASTPTLAGVNSKLDQVVVALQKLGLIS